MANKRGLIYSWGINDVEYKVYSTEYLNGKRIVSRRCPYYVKWSSIIERCMSSKYKNRGNTICEEWRYLSNFIKWVDSQPNKDWQNCEIDKDLLIVGNRHYSPDTCVFVNDTLNIFTNDRKAERGAYLIGVSFNKRLKKFVATCSETVKTSSEYKCGYLGLFNTEIEAHLAWKTKKHEYACILADQQDDIRLAQALRTRYL